MRTIEPGMALLREVRIGFIRQGTTLARWCDENGIKRTNARTTLVGLWNGPKGKAVRSKILRAAKIDAQVAA